MFITPLFLKKKIRNLAWNMFNLIENNGIADFDINGEKFFIDNLFKTLKKESIIFDIGANIGEYSLMLSKKAESKNIKIELHLFEPTKKCFEEINSKFSDKSNFYLNNFGCSDTECSAPIFYDKEKSGLASLYQRNLDYYDIKMDDFEEIILKRLDKYIDNKNIKHINFIKIDIEGHELKALGGLGKYLSNDFIDFIQFEYGGANLDSHTSLMEIYKLLKDSGFVIAKVMPNGLEIRDYSPYMENFMYSNYMAISRKVLG